MTILELSEMYEAEALRIDGRIKELQAAAETAVSREERETLRRRVNALEPLRREAHATAAALAAYGTRR